MSTRSAISAAPEPSGVLASWGSFKSIFLQDFSVQDGLVGISYDATTGLLRACQLLQVCNSESMQMGQNV